MTSKPNNLTNLNSINKLLKEYRPDSKFIDELSKIKFVLFTAPTASGRNSVIAQLLKHDQYNYIISDTTRPPRYNNGQLEQDGQVYWFKTEQEFLQSLKLGEYIEAAVIHGQQASGINISSIRKASKAHKIAITDIDIVGCESILKLSNNTVPIFLLPPSFDVWMKRLLGRGYMPEEEIKRRLNSAKNEIKLALSSDSYIFIVNDLLEDTVSKIHSLVAKDQLVEDQAIAIKTAKQLLKKLN